MSCAGHVEHVLRKSTVSICEQLLQPQNYGMLPMR